MTCIYSGVVIAGKSGVTLMARIVGANGEPITQASLSSITYTVTDTTDTDTQSTGTLTISSVVFNDLQQQDRRWTADSQARPGRDGRWGYNFRATLPASIMTLTTKQQADVKFTPVSGEVFFVPFAWTPVRIYGS